LHRIDGAPQSTDFSALPKQGRDNGQKAERRTRCKKSEQKQN
jgi:hypothetical protein